MALELSSALIWVVATTLGFVFGIGAAFLMFSGFAILALTRTSLDTQIPGIDGFIMLAYLGGIGFGWVQRTLKRDPLRYALENYLSRQQAALLLAVLIEGKKVAAAAKDVGIDPIEADKEFQRALDRLSELGRRALSPL